MSDSNKALSYIIKYACVQAQTKRMVSRSAGLSATKKAAKVSPQQFRQAVKDFGQFIHRLHREGLAMKGIKEIPKAELEYMKREADLYSAVIKSMAMARANSQSRWMRPINYLRYLWYANPRYVWQPMAVWGTAGGAFGAGSGIGSQLASSDTDKNYLSSALKGLLKGVAVGAPIGLGSTVLSGLPVYLV